MPSNTYIPQASAPLYLIIGIFFVLLPSASFGNMASDVFHHKPEIVGQVVHFIQPDDISLLPCTDQLNTDLAAIDWQKRMVADTGWRAAFSVALPVLAAYKRYKDCLKKAYPSVGNTP